MRSVDRLTDLLHKLAAPAAEEIGLIFGDRARAYRLRNLVATAEKARKILQQAALEEKPVPPRLLLPIIENSSVEDDDSLQARWAGLLASASQYGDLISASFVETLKQCTPHEAVQFDDLCRNTLPHSSPAKNKATWYPLASEAGVMRASEIETFERLGTC